MATQLENTAYTIGWIAALPHERAAAEAMLDAKHAAPQHKHPTDDNIYTLGSIKGQNGAGEHNIVIASLPAGHYGITPAAMAAAHMLSSFPAIKFGLMVGIGGGIPDVNSDGGGSGEQDIRLGDVVVSQPAGVYGGVRQYDLGKATVDGFVETGSLNCPPRVLLNAVSALQGKHEIMESEIPTFLADMREKYPLMARPRQGPGYVYQGVENDRLFRADYRHEQGNDCRACKAEKKIAREERYTHDPYIFYGTIASGNKVIKNPKERDLLLRMGCLCVETEAAGLMNDFPCLVIRGICDYCDSHKNDRWQKYAAATAAAYAKELLNMMDVTDVRTTPEARMIMSELRDLKSATNEIASDLKQLNQSQQRKALYKWLTPLNSSARHGDYQRARAEDTGQWMLRHAVFQDWSSDVDSGAMQVLCCFGDPGVGKTILTSIVIDHLSSRISTDPHSGLAYMYCDYRDPAHRKAENILGVIIKQLLERLPEIPDAISRIYNRCRQDSRGVSLEDARTMCDAAIAQFGTVYICLDALDELAQGPLRDLMGCMQGGSALRLYLTSRTHAQEVVGEYFENKRTIVVEAQEEDIRRFIVREIGGPNDVAPNAMDEKLRADITAGVVSSARGMFLLPVLQIRAILQAVTKRDREECLKSLPQDLGEAFTGTLSRIEQQANPLAELAKKVISWVHFGLQTFTVKMLKTFLAIRDGDTSFDPRGEPDVEPLLACCHGLIIVGDGASTIRLVHYSLQEFFLRQEALFGLTERQWHSSLAATCLTFLFFPGGEEDETQRPIPASDGLPGYDADHDDGDDYGTTDDDETDDAKSNEYAKWITSIRNNPDDAHDFAPYLGGMGYRSQTVFRYAALNWGHHFRQSGEQPGRAFELATRYLEASRAEIDASLSLIEHILYEDIYYLDEFTENLPFEVLGFFGLTKVGAEYWDENVNDYHEEGDTAISIAARMGHVELVALLIGKGAVLDMVNSVLKGPLHQAVLNGHEGVVRLLVEAGMSLDDDETDKLYDTPLRLAADCGHAGIVKYLLDHGAAIDQVQDRHISEQTALGCAVAEGNVEVATILLEAGASVEKGLFRPLYVAAGNGHGELVKLLLRKGADPNSGSGHGKNETPLLAAASSGNERVIEILIEAGARVNHDIWSELLYVAARGNYRGMVDLFIANGADLDCATGPEHNDTALHAAAWYGHADMVSLLLERGASPDPADDKGDTPLLRALRFGKMKAARALINNGANLERVNQYDLTPLMSATLSGKLNAVEMLIEGGAVVDLAAEFSRDHDEGDRDYRDYSVKDSQALEGLVRLIYSSTTWLHAVRPERRELIERLLHCSFFPNPSLATAGHNQLRIFAKLVKESNTFPRGLTDIGGLGAAILQSTALPNDVEPEWQWPLTVRFLLGLIDAMEEIQELGSFGLDVCHELLKHETHASHSVEDVCKALEIPSLVLGAKDVLDRVWIVAKRDILYSESAGSGTGLWVESDGKDQEEGEEGEEEERSEKKDFWRELEENPSFRAQFYGSASGEYGANSFPSDESESDQGGSDGYAADEDDSQKSASDVASDVASNEALDEAPATDPSANALRWRGWNMERLPTWLEEFASLLKTVRIQLVLRAEDLKKESKLGEQRQLAENAATLILAHMQYYDDLLKQTQELYHLWSEKLNWERW
ncbi:hypothetical protein BJY00DRAFT_283615 [Aspergillus carlsbadensis]|nr:hypothetical protein BJY00DRAFT_283615 [Aspergillus carlsbadensis]